MNKPTKKLRSSLSKRKHNLSGSFSTFKVTDAHPNKPTTSKTTIYENDGIFSIKAKENVFYALIKNPDLGYSLHPDFCYSVKLIPYSNQLMQVDGYRCKFGEQVKVSTCFGYVSLVTFSKSTEHEPSSCLKDIELVQSEVGDRYVELIAFDELTKLYDGQSVLLRVEIDANSMTQFKLVLEYILKASSPTPAHEQISRKFTRAPSSVGSMVYKNDAFVELNRRMNLITDKLNIVPRDVILVCGATNCGKSTLIHHMINRYLSDNSGHLRRKALYLECDPGQTEFAPSGILSLITIDKKVLSTPGFKFISTDHSVVLTQPRKIVSKIFGTTSPSENTFTRTIQFKLWLAFHCVNEFSLNSPYKNSAFRREINQLAYVTHSFWPEISFLPFFMNFTAKLPLGNLFVHCVGNPNICSSSVYDLLNASWVILGNISPAEVAKMDPASVSQSPEQLKLIHHELINGNCLGCGVVRAVDLSEQCMHILMPKALGSYGDTINLIVLPDLISIPSGLMSEQFLYQSNSCLPFIFSYFEPK
ncbi:Polynucleotide 5'-hydroxyl-kinase nol9 [Tyrophagus putrescentiae]|nr:Polynucleotide 5'-hydroxyl-kinase nol9 [Tyrophagus putrescentiae]